jgi:hypothetical protein
MKSAPPSPAAAGRPAYGVCVGGGGGGGGCKLNCCTNYARLPGRPSGLGAARAGADEPHD